MSKLYIIRHAESEGNKKKIIQGCNDCFNLTENGRMESIYFALYYYKKIKDIDIVLTSNMNRAYQTANIICETLSIKKNILKTDLLNEMNPGILGGISHKQAKKVYPNYYKIWCDRKDLDGIEDAEKGNELQARCLAFLESFLERENNTYLIVTHAGFMRSLINTICGNIRTKAVIVSNLYFYEFENVWKNIDCKLLSNKSTTKVYDVKLIDSRYILKKYNVAMSQWDINISVLQNKVAKELKYIPSIYWYGNKSISQNKIYGIKVSEYIHGYHLDDFVALDIDIIKKIFFKINEVHILYNYYGSNIKENGKNLYNKIAEYTNIHTDVKMKKLGNIILENELFSKLCREKQKLVLYDMHNMNILFDKGDIYLIDLDSVLYAHSDYQAASFIAAFCIYNKIIDNQDKINELYEFCSNLGYNSKNFWILMIARIYTGLSYFILLEHKSNRDYQFLNEYWQALEYICKFIINDEKQVKIEIMELL